MYDPRREARRQLARVPLPDDVDARDLDGDTRRQLMSLSKDTADLVARHLVMAGRLMDDEPVQALAHARAARALAGRVGAVREANGLVAYTAGEWTEALSELRAARRMTGEPHNLAVMADCERALGRPDRALIVTEDPQAKALDAAAKVELMIVASGARRDLGEFGTAVALLQVPALEGPVRPWTARLRYAYADALLDAGREDEARVWFARAAEVDQLLETDAEDRLLELDGMVLHDLEEQDDAEGELEVVDGQGDGSVTTGRAEDEAGWAALAAQAARAVAEPAVPGDEDDDRQTEAGTATVAPSGADLAVSPMPVQQGPEPTRQPPAPTEEPESYGRPAYRSSVVQDEQIPALGRAGSTDLGFLAPAAPTDTSTDEPAGERGDDDLRLFD